MRDCQPSPVALKNARTSGLYRTETNCFEFADFGRPRSARTGTIAFSCLGVSGCACMPVATVKDPVKLGGSTEDRAKRDSLGL